jgi:hypothetical protein
VTDRSTRSWGIAVCLATLAWNAFAPEVWWKFVGLMALWAAVTALGHADKRYVTVWCAGGGFGVAAVQLIEALS